MLSLHCLPSCLTHVIGDDSAERNFANSLSPHRVFAKQTEIAISTGRRLTSDFKSRRSEFPNACSSETLEICAVCRVECGASLMGWDLCVTGVRLCSLQTVHPVASDTDHKTVYGVTAHVDGT